MEREAAEREVGSRVRAEGGRLQQQAGGRASGRSTKHEQPKLAAQGQRSRVRRQDADALQRHDKDSLLLGGQLRLIDGEEGGGTSGGRPWSSLAPRVPQRSLQPAKLPSIAHRLELAEHLQPLGHFPKHGVRHVQVRGRAQKDREGGAAAVGVVVPRLGAGWREQGGKEQSWRSSWAAGCQRRMAACTHTCTYKARTHHGQDAALVVLNRRVHFCRGRRSSGGEGRRRVGSRGAAARHDRPASRSAQQRSASSGTLRAPSGTLRCATSACSGDMGAVRPEGTSAVCATKLRGRDGAAACS